MIATVSRRKPSLLVRWTAPIGQDISYVVQYSTTNQNTPPNDALELISYSASILLTIGIQSGTTYYVWVCAISNKLHGKYSRKAMNTTFQGTHDTYIRKRNCTLLQNYTHGRALNGNTIYIQCE